MCFSLFPKKTSNSWQPEYRKKLDRNLRVRGPLRSHEQLLTEKIQVTPKTQGWNGDLQKIGRGLKRGHGFLKSPIGSWFFVSPTSSLGNFLQKNINP